MFMETEDDDGRPTRTCKNCGAEMTFIASLPGVGAPPEDISLHAMQPPGDCRRRLVEKSIGVQDVATLVCQFFADNQITTKL
jgi:hypothetical protein